MPLYLPSGEGTHLYLNLSRVEMTTRDVVGAIERTLGLRQGSVGYAGLKDKFARTTQTFSVPVEHGTTPERAAEIAEQVVSALPAEKEVRLHWQGLHTNKLKIGHLLGNRFSILISEPDVSPDEALTRAQAVAEAICAGGVPNYLGAQRFGAQGDNALMGYEVIKRKRRVNDKWLRNFLVTSYQSHLCNVYLARRVEAGLFGRMLTGDVAKKHATGGIFVVEDAAAEQARFEAREISFTAPMFGFKMKRASAEAAVLEEGIEAETGITDAQWRALHTEGARRMGRLLLDDLAVEAHARGILVRFSLPKGAFATTVLREFMKGDSEMLPPQEIEDRE